MNKISILGTTYSLILKPLQHDDGAIDFTNKQITVNTTDKFISEINETIRHEIIHAALYESGLDCCSDWARNEEMIDWFAIQFDKLKKMIETAQK